MVPHGGGRPTRSGDHASLPSAETLPREAPAPHVSLLAQAALFPVPGWQVPLFGRPEENQLVELPVLRPCTRPPPPALPGLSTVLLLPSAALVHSAHLVPPLWIHPGVPGAPPLRCSPSCWPEAGPRLAQGGAVALGNSRRGPIPAARLHVAETMALSSSLHESFSLTPTSRAQVLGRIVRDTGSGFTWT